MKLLKSFNNDYPKWYAEYPLEWLTETFTNYSEDVQQRLEKDICDRGLLNPIVIRSPYTEHQTEPYPKVAPKNREKVFWVYVGNKRVKVAKKLGYTHISTYHVKKDEDARMLVCQTQMKEFVTT